MVWKSSGHFCLPTSASCLPLFPQSPTYLVEFPNGHVLTAGNMVGIRDRISTLLRMKASECVTERDRLACKLKPSPTA